MFGKRRFNSLFGDFDSLFNEMNSMFNDTPYYIKGKSNVENGNDENGKWTKESFISDDGSYSITTIVRTNTKGTKPEVSNTKLDQLKKELTTAVEEQEFETAAKLRDPPVAGFVVAKVSPAAVKPPPMKWPKRPSCRAIHARASEASSSAGP